MCDVPKKKMSSEAVRKKDDQRSGPHHPAIWLGRTVKEDREKKIMKRRS